MTSRGNIPWLPIRRYINRMQHPQSYLLLSTPYIFTYVPFYFISNFLNFFFSAIYTNFIVYQERYDIIVQKKYLHRLLSSNQNKFHPRPSSADYNNRRPRLFPPGFRVGNTRSESTISTERKETSRPESRRSVVHVHHLWTFSRPRSGGESRRKEIPWAERARHRQNVRSFVRSFVGEASTDKTVAVVQ